MILGNSSRSSNLKLTTIHTFGNSSLLYGSNKNNKMAVLW